MRRALFPGSFDPFTLGHDDIVRRALPLFDELVIAVGYNPQKASRMDVDERVATIASYYCNEPRIRVISYDTLTVSLAQAEDARFLVRGVRSVADYEYERTIADVNRQLTGLETILLFANPCYASLSSSMVRELMHFGHDVSTFLPTSKNR